MFEKRGIATSSESQKRLQPQKVTSRKSALVQTCCLQDRSVSSSPSLAGASGVRAVATRMWRDQTLPATAGPSVPRQVKFVSSSQRVDGVGMES